MPKFTSGPWFTGTEEDAHMVYDADLNAVADTLRDDGDAETEAANARLVAAAPALLSALSDLLELYISPYEDEIGGVEKMCLERVRAVISDATGGDS